MGIVCCQTAVLDIAVGFVLTAVEHQKCRRTLTEHIIGLARSCREQIHELDRCGTARLVVAAHHDYGRIRSEELHRPSQIVLLQLLHRAHEARHVAVEGYEIDLTLCRVRRQRPQDRVAAVYVVHNGKAALVGRRVERTYTVRLA